MPRITLERKVKVGNNIYKIKTETYELPEQILYMGQLLSYDSYHKEYSNSNFSIPAKYYLEIMLKQHKAKKQQNCKPIE